MFLAAVWSEETHIVKPRRSRLVNSERFVVGLRLRADAFVVPEGQKESPIQTMQRSVRAALDNWDDNQMPEALVPVDLMKFDAPFFASHCESTLQLTTKSSLAVKAVMDETEIRVRRSLPPPHPQAPVRR